MRDQRDVQVAHDVLHAVAAGEVELQLPEAWLAHVRACHDLLSWVLNGPCGDSFADNLAYIMRRAEAKGYKLERVL